MIFGTLQAVWISEWQECVKKCLVKLLWVRLHDEGGGIKTWRLNMWWLKYHIFICRKHPKTQFKTRLYNIVFSICAETYLQIPVWFLHRTWATVIQSHWAAVQKPLTVERHGSLTLTQTNSAGKVSVCQSLMKLKLMITEIYRKHVLVWYKLI